MALELNVRNILNVLHEAGFSDGDWFKLGGMLMENHANLRAIRSQYCDAGSCMIDMVGQWLRSDLNASWESLAKALDNVVGGREAAVMARRNAGVDLDERNILITLNRGNFTEWFDLGQQLIKNADLNTIEASHGGGRNLMIDMVALWLRSDPKASWKTLADTVEFLGVANAETVRERDGIGKIATLVSS